MRYCKRCVQPDTRPGIYFDENGVCGACLYQDSIEGIINWNQRQRELREIAAWAKKKAEENSCNYDCAIGVSGGKDSTFQALYARDVLGLRALLVNSEPEGITAIGRHNIENLKQQGFDVISIRPNPQLMKQLVKRDFYKHLNPVKITEYSLWSSTYIIADKFNISLIIQGENPGLTLGVRNTGVGVDGDALKASKLDTLASGLREYIEDGFIEKDIYLFNYDAKILKNKGIRGVWLQYFVKEWSLSHNAMFSISHGLKIKPKELDMHDIGTYLRYMQLDSELVQVNQMLKCIKFGFGQCTDHACYDIRARIITREEGIKLVKEYDGKCGGQYIQMFCDYIGITTDEFWRVANSFRGNMWDEDNPGEWKLKSPIWEQESINSDMDIERIIHRANFEDRFCNSEIVKV